MIKILETPDDLVKLHDVEDNISEFFPLDKNGLVQWLISQTRNTDLMVWGVFDNDLLIGYVVCYNCVSPPLSDYVYIIYAWLVDVDFEISKKMLEEIKEWAKIVGAKRIQIAAKYPDLFLKYGFEISEEVNMELVL